MVIVFKLITSIMMAMALGAHTWFWHNTPPNNGTARTGFMAIMVTLFLGMISIWI